MQMEWLNNKGTQYYYLSYDAFWQTLSDLDYIHLFSGFI